MFKKSIFSQLFFYTTIAILFGFIVMGVLMYGLLGNYLSASKEGELFAIAESWADFTEKLALRTNTYERENYQMYIDALSHSTDTSVVVLNTDGRVMAATSNNTNFSIKREFYEDVMHGQKVQYVGTLGGLYETTSLTVGVPIHYNDENAIIGGVFVSLAMPEINELRSGIIKIFLFAVSLVLIITLIIIFSTSSRITRPLKALNNASKAIADGHFERRVALTEQNEIGELGDSFNKMAESIEHLEDMRRNFIANVSHDLRTPMTTISGFVGGILDGTIPPEKHEQYLSIVLDETKHLSRLVTDLLDLSKLEQGNFNLEIRELNINELLRLSIIKSEKRITDKDIQLTVNFESDDQWVLADKDSILRVLTNLLDNAIKFTEPGGFMDIRTGMTDKNKVFVTIQNSGIGIDKDDLIHVFDRFYKSDKSRSLDKNGTGLGLYIVKNIIKSHGETIWVESEPDSYTRFNFTLTPAPRVK
ncbi:MAG: HAMP domain-containing histidine kinase [Clostridia bacterium]|nr:HAMP domain-containing histidine kinase [Clostridia bacterium]